MSCLENVKEGIKVRPEWMVRDFIRKVKSRSLYTVDMYSEYARFYIDLNQCMKCHETYDELLDFVKDLESLDML